ncbi:MAG TPA: translation initiation factor IF-2, partial [Methanomassiliicoccales archaeon]|nr:translation initiation factor IF-2 [Methanomassiliicoccales archaeon]
LEALAYECKRAGIPIRKYEIGDISKRDIIEVSSYTDPLHKVVLGFNVSMLPDAKDALTTHQSKVFLNAVVYGLIDDYLKWVEEEKRRAEEEKRALTAFPGKIRVLPDCVFRASKPAIVGVRVLAGRIRTNQRLISADGKEIGRIRSLRTGEDALKEATAGQEIAVAIEGATVGRQLNVDDILYVDIPESEVKGLQDYDLNLDEREVLEELMAIKRREDPFWGM